MALAARELCAMGVIDSPEQVRMSHRERVQKAYPAYFDTYDEMEKVVSYLSSFENLYCVGRNGQHRYNNMDHSMATSLRRWTIWWPASRPRTTSGTSTPSRSTMRRKRPDKPAL